MIPPCLTFSNRRYLSRVKWNNPEKGVAPSPTPRCSSYLKRNHLVALDYGLQLYFYIYIYIYIYIWVCVCVCVCVCVYISYNLIVYIYIYIYIYIYNNVNFTIRTNGICTTQHLSWRIKCTNTYRHLRNIQIT